MLVIHRGLKIFRLDNKLAAVYPLLALHMRALILMLGVLFVGVTAKSQALESDVYSINLSPVPPSALVSFSIGYPKGWKVTEEPGHQLQDVYYDVVTPFYDTDLICAFLQTNAWNETNWTSFTIFRSTGETAKDAAKLLLKNMHQLGTYTERSLGPIKTSAGDEGWLLECQANFKGNRVISHDFFFHCGTKGSIRIEIVTQAKDSSWRSELDHLVLETIKFGAVQHSIGTTSETHTSRNSYSY